MFMSVWNLQDCWLWFVFDLLIYDLEGMLKPAPQQIQIQCCEGADGVDNEIEKEWTKENYILR